MFPLSAATNGTTKSPKFCLWSPSSPWSPGTIQPTSMVHSTVAGGCGGQGRGGALQGREFHDRGLALGGDDRSGTTQTHVSQADLCDDPMVPANTDDFEGFALPPPALTEEEWPQELLWDKAEMDAELTLVRLPRA